MDKFLIDGTIKNSINFPDIYLDKHPNSNIRLSVINHNIPGVLSEITSLLKQHNINIVQQISRSSGDVAYHLFDLNWISNVVGGVLKESSILKKLNNIENTANIIRTRVIHLS